jgi:hypothetical protein
MQDGIYHVSFSSSVGGSGQGLVVMKQGAVNGGDMGYLYTGQLTLSGDAISGRLNIKRWNPEGPQSVFGPLDNFELQLTGKATAGTSFNVSGGIPSKPGLTINIAGRFLSNAA